MFWSPFVSFPVKRSVRINLGSSFLPMYQQMVGLTCVIFWDFGLPRRLESILVSPLNTRACHKILCLSWKGCKGGLRSGKPTCSHLRGGLFSPKPSLPQFRIMRCNVVHFLQRCILMWIGLVATSFGGLQRIRKSCT